MRKVLSTLTAATAGLGVRLRRARERKPPLLCAPRARGSPGDRRSRPYPIVAAGARSLTLGQPPDARALASARNHCGTLCASASTLIRAAKASTRWLFASKEVGWRQACFLRPLLPQGYWTLVAKTLFIFSLESTTIRK